MALIDEDGSGLSTAEAYLSVAEADAHLASRGTPEASWIDLDAEIKEQCLRRATDYMGQVYRERWQGSRRTATQALDWPRFGVYLDLGVSGAWAVADNIVPIEVQRACAELALRANSGDLMADLERGVVREQVGPLAVEYDRASPQRKRYSAIDAMLQPYLTSAGGVNVGLVRA